MTALKKRMKKVSMLLVFLFVFSLVGTYLPLPGGTGAGIPAAKAAEPQTIGDLEIGDKVVDNSWYWEYRLGDDYTHIDDDPINSITKPVTWIVVAKDHYGAESGVTLLSEEIIGNHTFDNSEDRGSFGGSNHWGDSGSTDAEYGLRKFLNGSSYNYEDGYGGTYSGDLDAEGDGNSYDVTFFDAFSDDFQNAVLTTAVPCRENNIDNPYNGEEYITMDKIFLPSEVEINGGAGNNHDSETVWDYFTGADNNKRIAREADGIPWVYWTRSPDVSDAFSVRYVTFDGSLSDSPASDAYGGVRPALNLSSEIPISEIPNYNGAYELWSLSAPAESVAISPDNFVLPFEGKRNLNAAVSPGYASNKEVTWSSDDEDIAVVDSEGTVTGVSHGETNIRAETVDGGHIGTSTVEVLSPEDDFTLSHLVLGDKVVDNSWEWEHRLGPDDWDGVPYSGDGITKPVSWIVAAKDHYGPDSGVTLFSGIIARHTFDDSSDRGSDLGSNHWGDSGSTDAEYGLRKFLNGSSYNYEDGYGGTYSGDPDAEGDSNSYEVTFFDAFSEDFQDAVLTTAVPCVSNNHADSPYDGEEYTTMDRVFLPSMYELGFGEYSWMPKHSDEAVWPLIIGLMDGSIYTTYLEEIEEEIEIFGLPWMRSPNIISASDLAPFQSDPRDADGGVFPVLNLAAETIISGTLNPDGAYEILHEGETPDPDPDPDQTPAPVLTTEAQTVSTATINIEGTAEANAYISITGGAAEATGTADGAGNFSIEVTLTPDEVNILSVTAQVDGETESEPVTVAITHETETETEGVLQLHVEAQAHADENHPYHVRVGLENKSDTTIYELFIEFLEGEKDGYYFAPGQELQVSIPILEPGETIWADYYLIPLADGGPLNLEGDYTIDADTEFTLSEEINYLTVTRNHNKPDVAPMLYREDNHDGTYTLSWDRVAWADGYRVYNKRDDLIMPAAPERIHDGDGSVTSIIVEDTEIDKTFIVTTLTDEGEILRHAGLVLTEQGVVEKPGDVTGTGTVSVADAILIARAIVGMTELTPSQIGRADVNNDGRISIADAILIARFVVGLITEFPA